MEPEGYGTVSLTSVGVTVDEATIKPGENNTIVIHDDNFPDKKDLTISATPATDATGQYTYKFDGWSVTQEQTITGDMTVTASFSREENFFTLKVASSNTEYGSISDGTTTAEFIEVENIKYGSAVTISGDVIKVSDKQSVEHTLTATPATKTDHYTYTFNA